MTTETIHYDLRFPRFRQHLVEIEAFFPAFDRKTGKTKSHIELMMPVWTPGSYLVREYSRNIESFEASDADSGAPLAIQKQSKNRWSVQCGQAMRICVRYRLYCHEASVRTNWVEESYGFLTGAATFLTLDDPMPREHTFCIHPPEAWPAIACSLSRIDEPDKAEKHGELWRCFSRKATSFDELVDSPILMGDLDVRSFEVSGKMHYLACFRTEGAWDLDRATEDCAKIVAVQHDFWGEIPYPSYWFINMAIESYGGLEHDNNTVLVTSYWAMQKRASYVEWLGLVSHEFFHTWNIRRLRPKNLVCYDYEAEQYTPELWIAEGITSYFDDLFVLRAGLATQAEYLALLDKTIGQVEEAPGRLVQTLEDSSFDTWIKHYRPDENSVNSRISYYTKGAVVAFLLDIHLRTLSSDGCSLADVMRKLWTQCRVDGYTLTDFESIASELVGHDLSTWFNKHVRRADSLDYQEAFDWLGLQMHSTTPVQASGSTERSADANSTEPEWELGCETAMRDGRIIVTKVIRHKSAWDAGIQTEDELIAMNGRRLPKENWKDRLQCYRNELSLVVTIARRGVIREIQITIQPKQSRKLQSVSNPTPSQSQHRLAWLSLSQ
ncbi:MAG: hypothetical protein SGI77_23160 [Pirellulaceae bacterium]|nr:hypothetical protein [Pirellulaceae bacterium]